MPINVYLNFNGNTREAIEFYAEVFGQAVPKIMTFGEVPADPNHPLPEVAKNMVMHSRLEILGSIVMFSDVFPGMPFTMGNNFSLSVVTEDREVLQSAFNRLQEGGNVIMELQETFWAPLYGSLTDKFGVQWQFNLGMNEF
ncbi:VOC family protein [Paenibacillus sp. PAMC21692]|uniref:VOC family protein n=1 Tax=Paenibacillus sp. PAMC21692 TaxID=2762320 RepID=UPI00164E4171|nr:VOC family protein [Paenibacillus sp. PAMC21692]QNK55264.1 VOC family protein [Paenibacillus sp. PAMC21692]